jgi:hypothetical protein
VRALVGQQIQLQVSRHTLVVMDPMQDLATMVEVVELERAMPILETTELEAVQVQEALDQTAAEMEVMEAGKT